MSSGRASICFVSTSPAMPRALTDAGQALLGGAELQMAMLARHLRRQGWSVAFLVIDYGQPLEVRTTEGIVLRRAFRRRSRLGPASPLSRSLQLWRSLDAVAADVYLMRGAVGQVGVVASHCRRKGARFVYHFGLSGDALCWPDRRWAIGTWERLLYRYGLRCANVVVVQSKEQLAALRRHGARDGVLIPNPCFLGPVPAPKPPEPTALWAGSLRPRKRPLMLLDIAGRASDVRFLMAGGVPDQYRDLAEAVNTRAQELRNVELLGLVPFQRMRDYYLRAHVLVHTSEHEGFPNTFLEAWSTCTPVVSTVDPDGVIGEHGIGFHCDGVTDSVRAVRVLCGDAAMREAMGARARAYVAANHSADMVLGRYERLLLQLASTEPESARRQPAIGRQ
jgi:glycosyltransferase involved in cell wall biosynthesis